MSEQIIRAITRSMTILTNVNEIKNAVKIGEKNEQNQKIIRQTIKHVKIESIIFSNHILLELLQYSLI